MYIIQRPILNTNLQSAGIASFDTFLTCLDCYSYNWYYRALVHDRISFGLVIPIVCYSVKYLAPGTDPSFALYGTFYITLL